MNHGCGFVLLAAQVSALPRPSWSQDSPTGSSVPKEGAHGDSSQGDTELPASLAVIFHYETAPYLGSLRNVTQGHDGWESAYWASPCCLPNRRGILPVSCLDCGGSAGHGPSGSSSAHSGGCPVPPPKLWVTRGVCAPSTTRQQHLQSERQHAALLPCCFISTPVGSLILAGGCSCLAFESGATRVLGGPAEPSAAQAASLHAEPQSGVWELQHRVLGISPAGCADPELHRAPFCPSNPVLGTARLLCSNAQHPWPKTHPQDSRAVGQTCCSLPSVSHAEARCISHMGLKDGAAC